MATQQNVLCNKEHKNPFLEYKLYNFIKFDDLLVEKYSANRNTKMRIQ